MNGENRLYLIDYIHTIILFGVIIIITTQKASLFSQIITF